VLIGLLAIPGAVLGVAIVNAIPQRAAEVLFAALMLFVAAQMARRRREAGLKLNHPESVALICDDVFEAARAGKTFDEAVAVGYSVLGEEDVLPGVAEMVQRIQLEPVFEDGSQLVTLHRPISQAGEPEP
jgi:urease subunit gamma/beta